MISETERAFFGTPIRSDLAYSIPDEVVSPSLPLDNIQGLSASQGISPFMVVGGHGGELELRELNVALQLLLVWIRVF